MCRRYGAAQAAARRMGRDAMDELAGTGGDHDALDVHPMKARQQRAQPGIGRIGVMLAVGLLQRGKGHGARPAGIGIGGKVV